MSEPGGRRSRKRLAASSLVPKRPFLLLTFGFSLLTLACGRPAAGPIEVALGDTGSNQRIVKVTGLSGTELMALRSIPDGDRRWPAILDVRVAGAALPVAGRYRVTRDALEFQPAFPFDAGRSYAMTFDPRALPSPRDADRIERTVALAAPPAPPRAEVSAVSPSSDRWPANLLRFYIHFSAPMSRETGVGRVHLLDATGHEVLHAFLPVDVDLWNHDYTRVTVLFDPGRVKRDILPNRELGRALVPARRYAIVVDEAWHDAAGQILAKPFRHAFVAGPPIEQPLDPAAWRIEPPGAGSRDPMVVRFPAMLDEALLHRALGVARGGAPIDGEIELNAGQTEWRFTPAANWARGRYELVALSILEDPSGNRIGKAFEEPNGQAPRDDREYRIPLEIK
jgi:hypothetical protein